MTVLTRAGVCRARTCVYIVCLYTRVVVVTPEKGRGAGHGRGPVVVLADVILRAPGVRYSLVLSVLTHWKEYGQRHTKRDLRTFHIEPQNLCSKRLYMIKLFTEQDK